MQMLHWVIRLAYPLGSIRKVLWGPVAGMRFIVVPGMGLTYAMDWDVWNFRFLMKQVRSGMVVYDVGANCGQMSLFFSRIVGDLGQVLSFEPVPQNAQILRRVVELNRLRNVEVFEVALASDMNKRIFRFLTAFHTMGTFSQELFGRYSSENLLEVNCLTIDEMEAQGKTAPDLIKIDVEGGALEVIKGALAVIEKKRPSIYLELHAHDADAAELQALRLLRDQFGYKIQDLNGRECSELAPGWGVPYWCVPPAGLY